MSRRDKVENVSFCAVGGGHDKAKILAKEYYLEENIFILKTSIKKKILLVNDHHKNTGVGNYCFEIFNAFRKMKNSSYSFHMLMQNVNRSYVSNDPDITVQYRPLFYKTSNYSKTYDLLSYFYFPRKIPSDYHVYHISSQMMGRSVLKANPTVITCHDLIPFLFHRNHKPLVEYLRKRSIVALTEASFIIFVSNHSKKDFFEHFDFDEERTAVIYEGVNSVFKQRDKVHCRKELGLPLDRPIILHVGSEENRKNPATLFNVISTIKKHIPNVLLIRIGGRRSISKSLISKLSLENNVIYYKRNLPQETLARFYNAADVFLFPSIYEGFGLPILEALKSGCPIVASDATSIPEIVGDAGILHDPLDVTSFANSIEELINNHILRESYVIKGLSQAGKFSWEETAQKTVKVYEKVLEITPKTIL